MHIARASTLDGFESLANSFGINVPRLLRKSGLPANALSPIMANSYLPVAGIERAFELVEQESNQPYVAAKLGSVQTTPSLLGVLGIAMQQCNTVGEALREVEEHFSFQVTGAYVSISREEENAVLDFVIQNAQDLHSTRHTIEFSISAAIAIIKSLCGSEWQPHLNCLG